MLVKGWKCKYCSISFWNMNLERFLMHQTGDSARCKGIGPCAGAPPGVCQKAVALLEVKQGKAVVSHKRDAESETVAAGGDAHRAAKVQQLMQHKTVAHCEVDGALSDMLTTVWPKTTKTKTKRKTKTTKTKTTKTTKTKTKLLRDSEEALKRLLRVS